METLLRQMESRGMLSRQRQSGEMEMLSGMWSDHHYQNLPLQTGGNDTLINNFTPLMMLIWNLFRETVFHNTNCFEFVFIFHLEYLIFLIKIHTPWSEYGATGVLFVACTCML
jgi:hypothetical protein